MCSDATDAKFSSHPLAHTCCTSDVQAMCRSGMLQSDPAFAHCCNPTSTVPRASVIVCAVPQAPTHLETSGPTYVTHATYDVVMSSVGAAVALVDAVVQRAEVCIFSALLAVQFQAQPLTVACEQHHAAQTGAC